MTNVDVTLPKHAVDGPQHATHETDTAKVLRPDGNGGVRWASAAGGGDMYKSTYDTDDDGVVDNAEQLGGVAAALYLTEAEHTAIGDAAPHHARYTDGEAVAAILAADGPGSGLDADTVDGQHYADISSEIDGDISTHAGIGDAHHTRYTDAEAIAAVPQATTSTQGKAELATESEMNTGTDTERIITPALLRTRELDIAELLFTEDDGLLLLGPGCPMAPDAWTSLRGQEAAISGAFYQVAGRWAGTLAIAPERATENYIDNPVFRDNVTDGWRVAVLGATITHTTNDSQFEYACAQISLDGDTDGSRIESDSETGFSQGDDISVSFYARTTTAWKKPVQIRLAERDSGDSFLTYTFIETIYLTEDWRRFEISGTLGNVSVDRLRIYFHEAGEDVTFYLDGVQLEKSAAATQLCYGDQSWSSWSGAAHDSHSTRADTELELDEYDYLISENQTMTLAFWVQTPYDSNGSWPSDGVFNKIFDARTNASNYIYLSYSSDTDKWRGYCNNGGSTDEVESDSVQSFSAGDWHHVVLVIDSNDWTIYVNGTESGNDPSMPNVPNLTTITLGGSDGGNFRYAEIMFLDSALSAAEISALYAAGHPLTDQSAIKPPADNLGPLAGAWPILFGSQTHTGDTSYSEAGSNQESRFGWGAWVSGVLQFEAVLKISDSGDTGYAMLQWNDSGTWRDVAGSEVSITGGTSADLVRSGVIYLSPDEREYRVAIKTSDSSQTVTIYKATLICTPGGLSEI